MRAFWWFLWLLRSFKRVLIFINNYTSYTCVIFRAPWFPSRMLADSWYLINRATCWFNNFHRLWIVMSKFKHPWRRCPPELRLDPAPTYLASHFHVFKFVCPVSFMPDSFLVFSSILKTEAICFSETLVDFHRTADWLTPRNWVLLEKLRVAQPLKNFPKFYGTRSFITVFTLVPILSQIDPVHTAPSYL
jgi:hypothetical protein